MDSNHDSSKVPGMCNLQIIKRPEMPDRTRNTPIGTTSVQFRRTRNQRCWDSYKGRRARAGLSWTCRFDISACRLPNSKRQSPAFTVGARSSALKPADAELFDQTERWLATKITRVDRTAAVEIRFPCSSATSSCRRRGKSSSTCGRHESESQTSELVDFRLVVRIHRSPDPELC